MRDHSQSLMNEARNALQRRDGTTARRLLLEIDERDRPWLLLAQACNMVGDSDAEAAALQAQLKLNARDIPALILTAEMKARLGDDRAAVAFFKAAINQASAQGDIPTALRPMLQRAEHFLVESQKRFEQHLLDSLRKSGLTGEARIENAIDLLLGKKQLYLQQPSSFYFPGLPQKQFYERSEFEWVAALEAKIPEMRAELLSVLSDGQDFVPYVESSADRPHAANPLINDPSWGAYYFWKSGEIVEEHAARCPATMAALDVAPMPRIDKRSPIALWSLLKPGTHIKPHHGLLNTRLICHIPLIIPENCALRVGNETRAWKEGEALIFDDSIEHEAWNRSQETRVVLLFEVWRPEITMAEREALTALFETINEYQGVPEEI
jgi:aspartyl/asparaginyl beta-hydroxylase (cupin superfamily)